LTAGPDFKDPSRSLCDFMRGYIRGVISSLPPDTLNRFRFTPDNIVVTHDPRSANSICTTKHEQRGCLFVVTAAQK
jgi:hypothetical protein